MQLAPDGALIRIALGRALLMQRKSAAAVDALVPAAPSGGRDALLGAAYAAQGDWNGAAAAFQRALDEGVATPELLNGLGWAHMKLGHRELASAALKRSLVQKPNQPEIRKLLIGLQRAIDRHPMSRRNKRRTPVDRGRSATRAASGHSFRLAIVVALALALAIGAALRWHANSRAGITAGRVNVLLVTIDTLRWDHLGCYGDRSAATPVLDALAGRGVRFATAIAQVPLTAPSHASILTGLTPLRHGVRDNGGYTLPAEVRTLARRLTDAGYRSAAFVSGFPLDHRFGFASGFDVYDDRLARTAGRAPYTERSADATTDRVMGWLDQMRPSGGEARSTPSQPWFAWVHYFDPHAPYAPPPPFATRFADRLYDGEVAFVDAQIGRLLGRLERSGDLARTLIVVTADHGESFGEHGEETHGVFVYDATLRVPFIVAGPGIHGGRSSAVVARSIDVVPTRAGSHRGWGAGRCGRALAATGNRGQSDAR